MEQAIQDAIEKIGTNFEQFKTANDERLKLVEARKEVPAELDEKVNKLEAAKRAVDKKMFM